MKVKLFVNSFPSEESKLLENFGIVPEVINIKNKRGKKQAEEWCVKNVPFLFFVSDDEKKTYYSISSNSLTKFDVKSILDYCETLGDKLKDNYQSN